MSAAQGYDSMSGFIHVNMATLMTIAAGKADLIKGGIAIYEAGAAKVAERDSGFFFTVEDEGTYSGRLRFTDDGRDLDGFRCTCAAGKDGDRLCKHIVAGILAAMGELPDTRVEIGKTGSVKMTVTDNDTAKAVVGGSLDVLSTPSLIALMEKAALAATEGTLRNGEITVGVSASIEHTTIAPLGSIVIAVARIMAVRGQKVTFDVIAGDGRREVGKGTIVFRYVDEKRFLAKILRGTF